MRIIARRTLVSFGWQHPKAKPALMRWATVVHHARWARAEEIVSAMPTAKTVTADRSRFEISGGDFRLIAAFDFRRQIAFVKFLGTHAEYDRIDAATVAWF